MMKPQTLEVMTNLSIEEIKGELKKLTGVIKGVGECDTGDLRNFATNCRNIADVAESLENIFLTAADEYDRITVDIHHPYTAPQ